MTRPMPCNPHPCHGCCRPEGEELFPLPLCPAAAGEIRGCIQGCSCQCEHTWQAALYQQSGCTWCLMESQVLPAGGCFCFTVPPGGCYLLRLTGCSSHADGAACRPRVCFESVGVRRLTVV